MTLSEGFCAVYAFAAFLLACALFSKRGCALEPALTIRIGAVLLWPVVVFAALYLALKMRFWDEGKWS